MSYPYRVVHLSVDYGQVKALGISTDGQAEEDHLHDGQGEDEEHDAHVAPHAEHVLGEQGADLALGGDLAQVGIAVLAALLVIGIIVAPGRRRTVGFLVELLQTINVKINPSNRKDIPKRTV